jgi:cellulose synthase/poly-beta-1,6-N-acetylglucosamine synthase-like glycosyltransferase
MRTSSERMPTGIPPKVSIVIPTRNRLHYLKEAVYSVRAQTFVDWQLLIVDDASDDGTANWLGTTTDQRVQATRMNEHVHRPKRGTEGSRKHPDDSSSSSTTTIDSGLER